MPAPSKTRLLYVDDDADTRDMIRVLLGGEGFEVACVKNPREFLKKAEAQAWDIYMLDTWLPEMTGFELCKRIKKFDSSTPIVFYSADAFEPDKRQALECGAFDYFVKPLPFEELIERIKTAVASRPVGSSTQAFT